MGKGFIAYDAEKNGKFVILYMYIVPLYMYLTAMYSDLITKSL